MNNIEILQNNNPFTERENQKFHSPYELEVKYYSIIKNGDISSAEIAIQDLSKLTIVAGKLSNDELRQTKYWAVCIITLATRYAIAGGLSENEALNYSDECIMKVDEINNSKEILEFLKSVYLEMTKKVNSNKIPRNYPPTIRKAIVFIKNNLHEKLSLKVISDYCGLSEDYLSVSFHKTTGVKITDYIKHCRLEEAKTMLLNNFSTSETAYYLNFCSESYFIKCFREEFGITPKAYIKSL